MSRWAEYGTGINFDKAVMDLRIHPILRFSRGLMLCLTLLMLVACQSLPVQLKAPDEIGKVWQSAFQDTAFSCDASMYPQLSEAWQYETNIYLVAETPNYLCSNHHVSIIEVDAKNEWRLVSEWEGSFNRFLPLAEGFIALSHWGIEGSYPQLAFSPSRHQLEYLALPHDRTPDCCMEFIERIALEYDNLVISYYDGELDVSEYWALPLQNLKLEMFTDELISKQWFKVDKRNSEISQLPQGWRKLDVLQGGEKGRVTIRDTNSTTVSFVIQLPELLP